MRTLAGGTRRPSAWAALGATLVAMLTACAGAPRPFMAAHVAQPFDVAAAQASAGLVEQLREQTPLHLGAPLPRRIVVDPMLDAGSGQQTAATARLQQRAMQHLQADLPGAEFLPFEAARLPQAQYLLTGTLARRNEGLPPHTRLLSLALTELKRGAVVAQAWSLVRADEVDDTPVRYYGDSPVLLRDRVIDGYVATSATPPGQPADPYYLQHLATAPMISTATALYNAEHYADSLAQFKAARAADGGDQLRTLNGLYLGLAKTGPPAEAEDAFGRLVAYGLAIDQLSMKFLFNPGGTTFDSKVSSAYPMWLRQIAKEVVAARACLTLVGHTSRTGKDAANESLSLLRAAAIRQRLVSEAGSLAERATVLGLGGRENLIGSGTDDAVDALDRRVEIRVVPCR